MARGLSQAIAATTSPSDSAGSAARKARRKSGPAAAKEAGAAGALISGAPREGRMDDALFRQFVARQLGHDRAVPEDVGAVAVLQFLGLGRIPEKGAPRGGLGADEVVDFELGAVVDAAHGIVHQDDPRVRGERAGEQRLLLVAARKRKDRIVHVRRPYVDALAPRFGERPLPPGEMSGPLRSLLSDRTPMLRDTDHCGKTPS